MNVLFLSISPLGDFNGHSISIDLLHEFVRNGHKVYAIGALQRRENRDTYISEESGCTVLRVKVGNNKKANIIEKGITTVTLPYQYISAIKKYFADINFDLVMYPTPPVTMVETVRFVKKRDGAKSYLLLKDIFPQNAVDIGLMTNSGIKGLPYKFFRKKEKQLYAVSDHIGCMSKANVDYVLKHNPEVTPKKVEVCPNSIEIQDMRISEQDRVEVRKKYNIPLDKTVFVYGGNLGKPQGIPFLINCLREEKENSNVFFLIVGDGTEYGKLEKFVDEESPKNMVLMKRLPKEDYDILVAACDVGMIFLDYRFTIPNFPSRLLGYMQAGLPVLACTDSNTDIGEVITNGKLGWSCFSDDVQAFKSLVSGVEDADCKTIGLNGFEYLKTNYTVSKAYKIIMKE